MSIITFYGVDRPDLFAIERAAMDRPEPTYRVVLFIGVTRGPW
jgi:hypothetical protein